MKKTDIIILIERTALSLVADYADSAAEYGLKTVLIAPSEAKLKRPKAFHRVLKTNSFSLERLRELCCEADSFGKVVAISGIHGFFLQRWPHWLSRRSACQRMGLTPSRC